MMLLLPLGACERSESNDAADAPVHAPAPVSAPAPGPGRATVPERFRGTWDATAAACDGAPGEMRLVIEAGRLRFHESIADVEAVRPGGGGAVRADLVLRGEGDSWRETRILRLLPHGRLEVELAGASAIRVRCGGEVAESALAGSDWELASSVEGAALFLADAAGARRVTFFCPRTSGDLLVNVPVFRAVGSEERMTFGSGGTVTTLVADPAGDTQRGGVTGRGPIPAELESILAGHEGIRVNYGAQDSGPHPRPPPAQARAFAAACRG